MPATDLEDNRVFHIDQGFGNRLSVWSQISPEYPGGGFVQIADPDRDAFTTIDFDIWDRITKAVAASREA